ncbi:MAG: N-formylglutamate amidohydrolase [Spirochaetes bacterium]|nr:N-formylglutamate amidohydrolase [Spirochaetota bacterium]
MLKKKYPILILIPHGGYLVPEELSGYETVDRFDLFMQADTCANDLFCFGDRVAATLDADASRLFVDLDRSYKDVSRSKPDGVVKATTLFGRNTFRDDVFPDETAIANILKRYYFPFFMAAERIIGTGEIDCVIECHTVMPMGPPAAHDTGAPRATVSVAHTFSREDGAIITCQEEKARLLLESILQGLGDEDQSIMPSGIGEAPPRSSLIRKFGISGVPYVRLSITKSLFINDTHFNYDYLRVDELRIRDLRETLWQGILRWYRRIS